MRGVVEAGKIIWCLISGEGERKKIDSRMEGIKEYGITPYVVAAIGMLFIALSVIFYLFMLLLG